MKKYKINDSVTIEAETQHDAVNIFFDSVPQGGEMQCVKIDCIDDLIERMKNLHENINQMRADVRRYSDIADRLL